MCVCMCALNCRRIALYCVTSKPLRVFSLSLCVSFLSVILAFSRFEFFFCSCVFCLFARTAGWMDRWMDERLNGWFSFIPFISFFHIVFHLTRFYFLDFVPNMYHVWRGCAMCICVSECMLYYAKCLMTAKETFHVTAHEPGMSTQITFLCTLYTVFWVLCTLHIHLKCMHTSKGTLINYSNHPLNLRANTFAHKFWCC